MELIVLVSLIQIVLGHASNDRPIVGVLAQETSSHKHGDSYLSATYVHYLEAAGARVVPILIRKPQTYYEDIFKSINGVLFPGGATGIEPQTSQYARSGQFMYNLAKQELIVGVWGAKDLLPSIHREQHKQIEELYTPALCHYRSCARKTQANDKNDYFPIWGTCQGHELLTYLTVGKNLLQHTDSSNISLKLDFTPDFRNSRLFKNLPQDVEKILRTENVTQNEHSYSIKMTTFSSTPALTTFYKPLSTNRGRDRVPFLSTMEDSCPPIQTAGNYVLEEQKRVIFGADDIKFPFQHKAPDYDVSPLGKFKDDETIKYPFYGVQWHPEKNAFNWNPRYDINHSADGVKMSQYFANFFINEARKSSHRFSNADVEVNSIIQNYQPIYYKDGSFFNLYFFNNTNT